MVSHTDGKIIYEVSIDIRDLLSNSGRVRAELLRLSESGSTASRGINQLERSASSAGDSLGKLSTIAKKISTTLVSNQVIAYAQSWNELKERIQTTGATASQTKDILEQLLVTSNRNSRSIEESAELYVGLSNSMQEMGYSTQGTLSYISSMTDLFTINKTSAKGTESAINALTEAQIKGKLAGDDAKIVFSNMPSVLETLTNYLKKNAKSTTDANKITDQYVKKLAKEGKLSIETFTAALIDSNVELDALADNMRNSVTNGLNSITNNLKQYFGELDSSTGATKLLVDSLILMSEHVDILMTGVGALAAIYAGKYITSLAIATKQSVEKTMADIQQAKATTVLLKAEIEEINQKIRTLEVQKQNIILTQTHCNSLRAQMALEKQLANVEAQLTTQHKSLAAAQTNLTAATRASSFAITGLRSAMSLLGGPAGILLLVVGGIMSLASQTKDATPQIRDYTKSIDEMKKSLKELTQVQLKGKIADLKDEAKAINKEISGLKGDVRWLIHAQEVLNTPGSFITMPVEFLMAKYQGTTEEIQNELDKLYAKIEQKQNNLKNTEDELKLATDQLSSSISKATKSTENLVDSLDEAARNKLDEKIRLLSVELEIAKLKQKGLNKEAYVAQALLSSLGDNAGKYQSAILNAAKNGKLFNDSIKGLPAEIQPLIMKLSELWSVTKQGASSISNTEASIKNLSTELQIAKYEAQGLIDKANELKAIQALGLDSSNSEQLSSNEAQIEQMKLLIAQQNQLNLAKNGMEIAKQEIDSRTDPVELLKDELKEKQLAINEAHEQGLLSEQQYNDAITAAKQNAADKQKKIEDDLLKTKMANVSAMLTASSDMFGGMADLTKSFAGESSSAYKALFAISRGFAIANAALNLQTALSNASAAPYPTNLAAYAQAATQGAQIISAISSMSYGGARKNGGPVGAGSLYRVGEDNKPEILMQGGRQYLIPGENGRVLNNRQIQSNQSQNIQWNFVVENYASDVEVSKPSIDYENKIVRTAVKQAKQEVANDISSHSGDVWRAMSNSTNIQSKL